MSFTESVEELVKRNEGGLLSIHPTWARVRLSEVVRIQNGFPFDSSHFNSHAGMPLIRIRDVLKGETETYFAAAYPKEFVVQKGDLLVGMDGDFHCSFWAGRPALLNQRLCRLEPTETFYNKRFLRFTLPAYLNAINAATSSITVKHLSSRTVEEIPLPLPPLPEQHRIVDAIDELFSDLDAGVANLERAKANLKRCRASVLKSAVEGRLTEEWRKANPQSETGKQLLERILRERRSNWEREQLAAFKAKGKSPPKDWKDRYEEPADEEGLFPLPQGWTWAASLQICERVESGSTPKASDMSSGRGEVPFIKVYNLTKDGTLDFTNNPTFVSKATHEGLLGRSRVRPSDVLMNIVGPPFAKVSVAPADYPEWNINQAIVLFRPSAVISPRFLKICLLSMEVLRWIIRTAKATAGQSNLSVANARRLPIPLPPLAEQEQIVALVEERLSQIDFAEKAIEQGLERAKRLRQSILKRAFEGRLVPQDPNDEPASVLLERIKASSVEKAPKKKVGRKTTKAKAR